MNQSQLYALYESDPQPVVDFLGYLRDSYDLPRPVSILDMGSGPGRMLTALSRAGWTVTGYEPDPDFAGAARKISESTPEVQSREAGLLDLEESAAFDVVALINGPYCYLLDPAARREALSRCWAALRPGGVIVLDLSNIPWILKNYREPPVLEVVIGGTTVKRTARHELDFHAGLLTHHDEFEWNDASGRAVSKMKTHRMAMVSFPEIRYFLEELGFEMIRTFNDFTDREPSRLTGKKLMVSARRRDPS